MAPWALRWRAVTASPVMGVADNNPAQSFLEIREILCEAKGSHDLGGHGNIIAIFPGYTIDPPPQAIHNKAKLAIIHVYTAAPGYSARIDPRALP